MIRALGTLSHDGLFVRDLQLVKSRAMSDSPTMQLAMDDETTRELTRIWQELLGLESVSADQNYFDLGGDSSLAVHLFARIEKQFHIKLPLATLFEAPTIEELARVVREHEAESAEEDGRAGGWSPLVAIQKQGTRPAFFCMHGAGGNVLIYRELAQHLGADQPFYGLQAQGLDGSRAPLGTIEEMATLYAKEIRRVQAHGPYLIGGYCMGGTLAYEVARQLRESGEEISLLALFDTMDWSNVKLPSFRTKVYHEIERMYFHAANFFRLDGAGKKKFFGEKVEALRNRLPVWKGMLAARFSKGDAGTNSHARVLGDIWKANDQACIVYVPRPFAGVVTDFRPMKQYRMFDLPNVKWERLAEGGEQVVNLPVYPAGMLVEPFVRHLATALRARIDNVIAAEQTAR
jgi:phthiocerol/phenolphthiocerol synthesis type-I polyketide synthase E